jgi:hypothetical protein
MTGYGCSPLILVGLTGGVLGFLVGGVLAMQWDPALVTAARVVGMTLGAFIAVVVYDRTRKQHEEADAAAMTFATLLPRLAEQADEDTAIMAVSIADAGVWTPAAGAPLDIHDPVTLKSMADQFATLIHDGSPALAQALADFFQAADDLQEVIDVDSGFVVLEDAEPRMTSIRRASVELTLAIYRLREQLGLPDQDFA